MPNGTWRSLSKMRLTGGVVGKVAMALIFGVVGVTTIVAFTRTEWVALGGIAIICLLVLIVVRWIINFADRHPEAALLEGAEFMKLQGSKDNPKIVPKEFIEDHPLELGSVEDQKLLMQPDVLLGDQLQIPFDGKEKSSG
jgi:hypothetical protein